MAVDAAVGDEHTLGLGAVGTPGVVGGQHIAQLLLVQDGTVQAADGLDVQRGGLFQHGLHLHAVFADDADEVSSGLIVPGLIHVQSAEFAEAVGGEEYLVGGVIGHNDLGPVHHGGGDKGKRVLAE